ncbi:hypothetical protein AWH48_08245 [Domibacillus aminovorans]|uniref:Yip1 domain-containing protein n=1 Tax=Domibacillus aminovorans TaxID=29332 RepID=A0A177KMH4_9BACI|nr:hypothetical protein [Domibacillus aminovorans]OAH54573.1 hypothetical protein AWH48_08245 [Domibacillus aminovorans]
MAYRLQLFKGLFRSTDQLYQLSQAEKIRGLWTKFSLLLLGSVLLSLLAGYLGIQGESVSTYMAESDTSTYEWLKVLFAAGSGLWGLLFPLFFIFIPALLFWTFLEIDFKKLVGLQCIVLTIYLIEYALLIAWNVFFSIPRDSSPFSLGVAAQYATENVIAIRFFSFITIFQVWILVIQYRFLRTSEAKGAPFVFLMVFLMGLVFWILSTLFTSIHVENLF